MRQLIPMTDFVLVDDSLFFSESDSSFSEKKLRKLKRIENYANLLKQPLKLEMFVPCDEDGNVLEEPIYHTTHSDNCYCKVCEEETKRCDELQKKHQKAKEKVLFEGFEYISETKETWLFKINGNFPRIIGKKLTIESLKMFKDQIQLTPKKLTESEFDDFQKRWFKKEKIRKEKLYHLSGLAMQGLLSNPAQIDTTDFKWVAEHAIGYAKALLKQLEP